MMIFNCLAKRLNTSNNNFENFKEIELDMAESEKLGMSKGNSYSSLRYKGLISDQQYKNIKQGQKALKAIELIIGLDRIYPNSDALDEAFAIIREQVGIEPYKEESEDKNG